ncbi:dnaJ homolog subfamily B member 12-like [Centruroides sculpturatus]|uniref:dnaJ homolog subfamily B member 12-like n=1 Tax=Centruroides sculpturatus TaxID=218467 RepID=UPI000C6D67CE|nr:dnaJ homolog subfamily B member 12-like [Centruroides sculpturatus]
MDGNKDECEKCISFAVRFINEGRRDLALKYLRKADRLYPCQKARDLINLLEKLITDNGYSFHPKTVPTENAERDDSQSYKRSTFINDEEDKENEYYVDDEDGEYTEQSLENIQRIRNCKDYYKILGVSKESKQTELKRQYRKLSLLYHPDKNRTPGSEEAFKAICQAFSTLNDPEKKKQYDLLKLYESSGRRHTHSENKFYNNSHVYNKAPNRCPPRERRWYHRREAQREPLDDNGLIAKLLLAAICLSLACTLYISEPTYSLSKTPKFSQELKTKNLNILYYVKESFEHDYTGSVLQLEAEIEKEYVFHLKSSCFRERNYKETMIWRAKNLKDRNLEEKAKSLQTPSCDTLLQLYHN